MRIRQFVVACCFCLCLVAGIASAGESGDFFTQGNELYKKGDYSAAKKMYLKAAEVNNNAAIFFNIGNCYYKEDRLAEALVFYKRAQRISPRDIDTKKNIRLLRSLQEQVVDDNRKWYVVAIESALDKYTYNELMSVFLILVTFSLICFYSIVYSNIRWKRWVLGYLLFFSISAFTAAYYKSNIIDRRLECVISKPTDVYSAPINDALVSFSLKEGVVCDVVSEDESWIKVRLVNNSSGWISKDSAILV